MLVVDDDPDVTDVIEEVLSLAGIEVVSTQDGEGALSLLGSTADGFDGALVDLSMPGLSGIELIDRMRVVAPDLPVLLMSGYSEHDTQEALRKRPLTRFLQKPFGLARLTSEVEQLIASGHTGLGR